jgi:nicotinamide mononucleotide (NMN) deamidase PncC
MAEGGLSRMQAALAASGTRWRPTPRGRTLAVAVTGIAGPAGGTAAKPVGLCYVALAGSDGTSRAERIQAPAGASRAENRAYFTERALELADRCI